MEAVFYKLGDLMLSTFESFLLARILKGNKNGTYHILLSNFISNFAVNYDFTQVHYDFTQEA